MLREVKVVEFYAHMDGVDYIKFRRSCKAPKRTGEYRRMLELLSKPNVRYIGWRTLGDGAGIYPRVDLTSGDVDLPF